MINEELVKNQKKTHNQVNTTYVVTAKYGNTESVEKPVLEALKPGIRLHFLRYGYFLKKSKTDRGFRIGGSKDGGTFSVAEMDCSNDGVESTEQFYVGQTTLRKGYIYLINDENINDYHELAINDNGKLSNVPWWENNNLKEDKKTAKDKRVANEKDIS